MKENFSMKWIALTALACGAGGCALEPRACREGQGGAACDCPAARLDASGVCCAAWSAPDDSGQCMPRAWTIPGDGDGTGDPGAQSAAIAIDGAGRATATWEVAADFSASVVVGEEGAPGPWSIRLPSNNLEGLARGSRVAIAEDGAAVVTWVQDNADTKVMTSERDASGRWIDPEGPEATLSFPPNAHEPDVATSAGGGWILAWNQWMSTGYGVASAQKSSLDAPWTLPADADDVLSPHVLFTNAPRIALNDSGDALIVWYQSTGGPLMVFASERHGPNGEFSRPSADSHISAPGAPVDSHPVGNPQPALNATGEAAVVWTQENGEGAIPVYLALRSPEGAWTTPRDLGDAFSPPHGVARCPQVAFGKDRELFIVWYQDEGEGNRVLAAHRAPDGAWDQPGSAPAVLSSPGATAFTPALAATPYGEAVAAWIEATGDGSFRMAARRAPLGDTLWGPIEALSPAGAGDASAPALAIGGPQSRVVAAWTQGPGFQGRIYFASID